MFPGELFPGELFECVQRSEELAAKINFGGNAGAHAQTFQTPGVQILNL